MPFDKKTRKQMLAHCDELRDDDGVDPREFFRPPSPRPKHDRKTLQLCSQVAETLSLIFAGELNDGLLQVLQVVSVDPAPNGSQLAVTLRAPTPLDEALAEQTQQRLNQAAPWLRCEVAAAITRKRTPRLIFRLSSVGHSLRE
jgi:ribosome-binding factor A